jgi:pre-mRNA-splicing factor ISY1
MGYVPASKKEIKHQKQSLFDKVREEELIEKGLFVPDSKRPFTTTGVTLLKEAEFWRQDIIKELVERVENIADRNFLFNLANLDNFRCREWNDIINKLMKEKTQWEQKIKELGGPDYLKKTNLLTSLGGVTVPGTKGYMYFGQAKYLPGVKELFEQAGKC